METGVEALDVFKRIGIELEDNGLDDPEYMFDGSGGMKSITYDGRQFDVHIHGIDEEGARAVAFNLTGRYRGYVIDAHCPHGREDPFVLDPFKLCELLTEVRTWWPEAQLLLIGIFY